MYKRLTQEVSTDVCQHCDQDIVFDSEMELYIDSHDEADCKMAPRDYRYGPLGLSGTHEVL